MKIVFIGAGRLATQLGKALLAANHDVIQVYSRTQEHADRMALLVGGAATNDLKSIVQHADVYILSVKDDALPELIPQLCKNREQKVFIHTAGSIPMDVFRGMALHYGVLYPMQTFSWDRDVDFSQIPCFMEGNDTLAQDTIGELACSISNTVYQLSSEDRKYLHLAAVFACNFTNHCYAIAEDILKQHQIPFDVMYPLIDETARKIHEMSPSSAQTGPAVRYDENVIRAQSQLWRQNPFVKDIYDRISMNIHRKAQTHD